MVFSKESGIKGSQMTCNEAAVSLVTVSNVTMLPATWLCVLNRHSMTSVLWIVDMPISHAFVSLYFYHTLYSLNYRLGN